MTLSNTANTPKIAFLSLILLSLATLMGWLNASFALALGLVLGWVSNGQYEPLQSKQLGKWAGLLLKIAIVALGLTLPFTTLVGTAKESFWLTIAVIGGTLAFGLLLAKLLKLDKELSWLISSGTAICGGSAIAAVGSSISAKSSNMVIALAIVFILNAVALFVYPLIGHWLELSQTQFGLWAAIGIHDTSSVVGAASQYGEEALEVATTTKLARALWIIPVAILAAVLNAKDNYKISIPWFIVFFVIASLIGGYLNAVSGWGEIATWIKTASKHLFALSLLWMGASLNKANLQSISSKTFALGLILWLLISSIGLAVIYGYF